MPLAITEPDIKHNLVVMSERSDLTARQVTETMLYTRLIEMQERVAPDEYTSQGIKVSTRN